MQVVYSQESPPPAFTKSLFLAGPSPRDKEHPNWRPEALKILAKLGYDGVVFVPLPRDGGWPEDYNDQVGWEQAYLNMADLIVFWVPRDLDKLPASTTNVEFGEWVQSGKALLGYPEDAPKMRYLAARADAEQVPHFINLRTMLRYAVEQLGAGALRVAGQRQVPLYIWRTPSFQDWLRAQEHAGNMLCGARVVWTFRVGPERSFVFFWALHVDVFIAAEKRHKTNEVVLGRPDISTIVAYEKMPAHGDDTWRKAFLDTPLVIIREFRSPATTPDGFIRELAGGSSWTRGKEPKQVAASEFREETGISIAADRFQRSDTRQVAGTLSAHSAHTFMVELTSKEMEAVRQEAAKGEPHGVEEDTERTYIEHTTVAEAIRPGGPLDWANLGMLLATLLQ